MESNAFGQRLRLLRHEHDPYLTQTDLGELIGETQPTISKWENGQSSPEIAKLLRVAKALGTSVDYLLSVDEASHAS